MLTHIIELALINVPITIFYSCIKKITLIIMTILIPCICLFLVFFIAQTIISILFFLFLPFFKTPSKILIVKYSLELSLDLFYLTSLQLLYIEANSIISIILQRAFVQIIITICNDSIYYVSVKDTYLCIIFSISYTPSFTSPSIKLSLVNLMSKYLPTMKLFKSIFKLSNILKGIRNENTIAMQQSIFPLSNIFNPMTILLLDCFETIVFSLGFEWNILKLIIRQSQLIVECKVKLLQLSIILCIKLTILWKAKLCFQLNFRFTRQVSFEYCRMQEFLINYS